MNENRETRGYLRGVGYYLLVGLTVIVVALTGPVLWVWPEHSSRATSTLLGWLPHEGATKDQVRELGGQLTGGAVVAFAVVLVERLAERRFRQSERQDEARNFRLLLGLQQDLTGMDLKGRDLRSAVLRAKNLTDADLENTNLAGADLTRARVVNASFAGAMLTATAFVRAEMHGCIFLNAMANSARMKGAQLNDAVLDNANLQGADLREADLRRTSSWETVLYLAQLQQATLVSAGFVSTNLERANLEGANCSGAVFVNANLSGANLSGAALTGARYDTQTTWPAGFDAEQAGARPIAEGEQDSVIAELEEQKCEWYVDSDGKLRIR